MIKKNKRVLISIVTYHSDLNNIQCIIENNIHKLIFISIFDNSENEAYISSLKNLVKHYKNVRYFSKKKNIGFGGGHNSNIIGQDHNCYYSAILNPDIEVSKEKVFDLIHSLDSVNSRSIKIISPFLLNSNTSAQHFIRLFPCFLDFIYRIINIKQVNYAKKILSLNLNRLLKVPFAHGAFYLINTNDYISLGGFSNNFFLYCEDLDLCSRICSSGGDVFVDSKIKVIHKHNRASRSSFILSLIHLSSILKYLTKHRFEKFRFKLVNEEFLKNFS